MGQRFRLRSALSEQECQRRLEEVSRSVSLLTHDTSRKPAAMWKPVLGKKRIYAWYPLESRSPWLRGSLWRDGAHTIIAGRSGADFVTLTGASVLGVAMLYGAWGLPPVPFALLMLLPVLYFVLRRNSPGGEQLIDFVQELLDAEDVLARPDDPVRR